jgi:hypothetical protein
MKAVDELAAGLHGLILLWVGRSLQNAAFARSSF